RTKNQGWTEPPGAPGARPGKCDSMRCQVELDHCDFVLGRLARRRLDTKTRNSEGLKDVARKTTGLKISLSPLTMAAAVLSQLRIDSHRTKGGEGALIIDQQIINKTRYNLQSGWLPTDHGPTRKWSHRAVWLPCRFRQASLRLKSRLVPPSLKSSRTGPLCTSPPTYGLARVGWLSNFLHTRLGVPEVIVAAVPVRYGLLGPQAKLLILKVPRKIEPSTLGLTQEKSGKNKREPVAEAPGQSSLFSMSGGERQASGAGASLCGCVRKASRVLAQGIAGACARLAVSAEAEVIYTRLRASAAAAFPPTWVLVIDDAGDIAPRLLGLVGGVHAPALMLLFSINKSSTKPATICNPDGSLQTTDRRENGPLTLSGCLVASARPACASNLVVD
ncbi:hypothetical protein THAOC_04437, partial [Thalassiosira oceanica]